MRNLTYRERMEQGRQFMGWLQAHPPLPFHVDELKALYQDFKQENFHWSGISPSLMVRILCYDLQYFSKRGQNIRSKVSLSVDQHIAGRVVMPVMPMASISLSPYREPISEGGVIHCDLCDENFATDEHNTHLFGATHQIKLLREKKPVLEEDKGGVQIGVELPKGPFVPRGNYKILFSIKNVRLPRRLLRVNTLTPVPEFNFNQPTVNIGLGETFVFGINFVPVVYGIIKTLVLFAFEGFTIGKYLELVVEDINGNIKSMAPISPYKRKTPHTITDPSKIIPGVPPPPISEAKYVIRLKQYPIPDQLRHDVNHKQIITPGTPLNQILESPLTPLNYEAKLSTLLHLEEMQMEVDIRHFDMKRVTFGRADKYYTLEVPGLSEKRPSVMYGDQVFVSDAAKNSEKIEYQGYVHAVQLEQISLEFDPSFTSSFMPGNLLNVRFVFNRTTLRRSHQSVSLFKDFVGILFPSPSRSLPLFESSSIFNRSLNVQQKRAVNQIVIGSHVPNPYILYGPAGTGKTITLIECILRLYFEYPDSRILACGPSNSAADIFIERLIGKVDKGDLLRMNAIQRSQSSVPKNVLPYCYQTGPGGTFKLPPVQEIMKKRIVVSTCITSGALYSLGCPRDFFTHVIIDEAGHAEEPETITSFAGLCTPATHVILAGDMKQLGPVVRSPIAQKYGFETSFLERLTKSPVYLKEPRYSDFGGYNPTFITKLLNNYRSHTKILQLPNQLFYDNELKACADPNLTNSLLAWEGLPNHKIPLLFIGIKGKDARESNSPSWFNAMEAAQVLETVNQLFEYRTSRLTDDDIGIITPYRKQVEKIRNLLQKNGHGKIRVGSVEEFQGQEKRVIIVSTVRSNPDYIEMDKRHNLGFLNNPKRFNVTMTRAQALLITIGNPDLLNQDKHWSALLKFCIDNKCYTGCVPPEIKSTGASSSENEVDRLIKIFHDFSLASPDGYERGRQSREVSDLEENWERGEFRSDSDSNFENDFVLIENANEREWRTL